MNTYDAGRLQYDPLADLEDDLNAALEHLGVNAWDNRPASPEAVNAAAGLAIAIGRYRLAGVQPPGDVGSEMTVTAAIAATRGASARLNELGDLFDKLDWPLAAHESEYEDAACDWVEGRHDLQALVDTLNASVIGSRDEEPGHAELNADYSTFLDRLAILDKRAANDADRLAVVARTCLLQNLRAMVAETPARFWWLDGRIERRWALYQDPIVLPRHVSMAADSSTPRILGTWGWRSPDGLNSATMIALSGESSLAIRFEGPSIPAFVRLGTIRADVDQDDIATIPIPPPSPARGGGKTGRVELPSALLAGEQAIVWELVLRPQIEQAERD